MRVIYHRPVRLSTLLAVCALATASCSGDVQPEALPNLVLIVADDLGWNDVGYHGSNIRTPRIDALVAEGVELDRFYAFPVCSPTRAALMTGRSAIRHGLCYASIRPYLDLGLPQDEVTLADLLRSAGYQTACVGKWHLGHTYQWQHPNARGFDYFYGHLNGTLDYDEHTRHEGIDWQRNGATVREAGYSTDLIGAEAARVIRDRDTTKPLFLYVPFNAPHQPNMAPEAAVAEYAHLPNADRRTFAAMVSIMDRNIGTILDALESEGLAQDTLVLFISDNGGLVKQGSSNKPLKGQKHLLDEGGTRVVAAGRWPGVIQAGSKSTQFSTVMDVLPTFALLGHAEFDELELDGKPQLSRWLGESAQTPPSGIVFAAEENDGLTWSVYDGKWKLARAIRDDGRIDTILFDIDADPTEERNLARANPEVVERLAKHIEIWTARLPDNVVRKGDDSRPDDWQAPADWAAAMR